ncbi:MAG: GTPase [Vulcanimicrobiota bacterium]
MNQELEELLQILPPDSQSRARQSWNQLPADVRAELALTYSAFSKLLQQKPSSVRDFLRLMRRATGPSLSEAWQVAILGPANVGKSTLFNALLNQQEAETGPVPGTTRHNHEVSAGLFNLVDTPGADHADQDTGAHEKALAFEAAERAHFLIIVFDATSSVSTGDKALFQELKTFKKPYLVVLNKLDRIPKRQQSTVLRSAARILGIPLETLLGVSALEKLGVEQLVLEMTALEPQLLVQVGEQLPEFRRQLSWQAVRRAAIASAFVALTPLPVVDLIPLALLQGTMVTTLARIHAQKLGPRTVLELGSTFGVGWLARMLFREVSKLAGAPGWVISASIASSATLTIGFAAITWFETGKKPEKQQLEDYARQNQGWLAGVLARLGKGKPDRETLEKHLEQNLDQETG